MASRVTYVLWLVVVAASVGNAHAACTTPKTLAALLSEWQSCTAQGLPGGCLTPDRFGDIICSMAKVNGGDYVTVPLVGSTFTPDFLSGTNFTLSLDHALCPCTLANPNNQANQTGVFEIIQSSTGSDLISTYGTNYLASTEPTISTVAGAKDYVAYAVNPAGKIVFGSPILNAN